MRLPTLFNPSNDMALAANLRQYFPPHRIRQMEDDLAPLARLWDEGPWGWSLATRQRYLRMGIPAEDLPTDDWLAEVRRLSSRAFGVAYYQGLTDRLCPQDKRLLPCRARFCTTMAEVQSSLLDAPSSILKSPWSSSGRGNIVVNGMLSPQVEARIGRTLREQGGMVAEPYYEGKILDFAMEFRVGDNGADFLGYSVFSADETGHYGGNYVESQAQLLQRIDLPGELLQQLVDYHRRELARLNYRGFVGIDMMEVGVGGKEGKGGEKETRLVHPCVEINFRMTMGLLAILLYNKGIKDDQPLTPRRAEGFTAEINQGKLQITYCH